MPRAFPYGARRRNDLLAKAATKSSAKKSGLATAWNTESAIDGDRQKTEREAFDKLVGQIETMWAGVVTEFGPNSQRAPAKVPTGG